MATFDLDQYLRSQANNFFFIFDLASQINNLSPSQIAHPQRTQLTILVDQKITLAQAWQLITDFLTNNNAPSTLRYQTHDWQLTPKTAALVFLFLQETSLFLQNFDPKNIQQLLDSYRTTQLPPTIPTQALDKALQRWHQQIKEHNDLLARLQKNLTSQPTLPFPHGHQLVTSLPTFIAGLAPHLIPIISQARQTDPQGQLTPDNFHTALAHYLAHSPTKPPSLSLLEILLHDPQNRQAFFKYLQPHLPQIDALSHLRSQLALSPPPYLPISEIERQLFLVLHSRTNLSFDQASSLAQQITTAIITNSLSSRPQPPANIIASLLRKYHPDPSQVLPLLDPLFPHLEFYQQRSHLRFLNLYHHHRFPRLQRWLLKTTIQETGLDPSALYFDPREAVRFLGLPDSTSLNQLHQAIQAKLQSPSDDDDLSFLLHLQDKIQQRLHLETNLEQRLTKWTVKLLLQTNTNLGKMTASLDQYALVYQKGWQLYLQAEEILTGEWLLKKIIDKVDAFKQAHPWAKFVLSPLQTTSEWWSGVVTKTTQKWLTALEGKTGFLSKFTRNTLQLFKKGNYTINGFTSQLQKLILAKIITGISKLASAAFNRLSQIAPHFTNKLTQAFSYLTSIIAKTIDNPLVQSVLSWGGPLTAGLLSTALVLWNLGKDGFQFIKGLWQAFLSPYFIGSLKQITSTVRVFLTKNISALTGIVIGAFLGGLPGALLGFFLGHEIGAFLNNFYEKHIRPYLLFFASLALTIITSLGAVVLSGTFLLLGGPILLVALLTLIFFGADFSARLPIGSREGISALGPNLANQQSPYLGVQKTISYGNQSSLKTIHLENSQLPQTITYTIDITAKLQDLNNITIQDKATLYSGDNKQKEITLKPQSQSSPPQTLAQGEHFTYQYQLQIPSTYQNSTLINTVTVTANLAASNESSPSSPSQNQQVISIDSTNIDIGTPPTLPLATFAQRLARALNSPQCKDSDGNITLSSLNKASCSQILSQFPSSIPPILKTSAKRYTFLQCVGFVHAVLTGVGLPFRGEEYAGLYVNNPPAGFQPTPSPHSGDIFVIEGNPGHIGIVVQSAGSLVYVADANIDGRGNTRANGIIPISDKVHFFHPISP